MRPHPTAAAGFSLVELLVAASLASIVVAGTGAALLAITRAQARLLSLQNAADVLAISRVQYSRSTTAPAVPVASPVSGCRLAVLDASGAPWQVQMQATCGDGPLAVSLPGWLAWAPPAPTPSAPRTMNRTFTHLAIRPPAGPITRTMAAGFNRLPIPITRRLLWLGVIPQAVVIEAIWQLRLR